MVLNLFRYRKRSTTKCREIHFIKAETGQQSPRQRPDGDRRSDDEEKEKYRDGLIATCKVYCHIDYDDDMEILELMFDVTMQEMTELIPNFDQYSLTSRQKLLAFISVKELYDNRDKYRSDTKLLASAASSMLLKEIYGGAAQ